MIATVVLTCLGIISIILGSLIMTIYNERQERMDEIRSNILTKFDYFKQKSDDNAHEVLMEIANQMEILKGMKDDIRPYDLFDVGTFHQIAPKIVIDKNLEPKLIPMFPSDDRETRDVELKFSLNHHEVVELAMECKKIKMDKEIEDNRLERIKKTINGSNNLQDGNAIMP